MKRDDIKAGKIYLVSGDRDWDVHGHSADRVLVIDTEPNVIKRDPLSGWHKERPTVIWNGQDYPVSGTRARYPHEGMPAAVVGIRVDENGQPIPNFGSAIYAILYPLAHVRGEWETADAERQRNLQARAEAEAEKKRKDQARQERIQRLNMRLDAGGVIGAREPFGSPGFVLVRLVDLEVLADKAGL